MTEELLNARLTKLNLQKISLKNKTQEDKDRYVAYRNYYNTLLRQSKQRYYSENLNRNVKNPKRSWELLKEAANLNKTRSEIDKLCINGNNITDKLEIANEFNDFFSSIGVKIAESVKQTTVKPEDYMPNLENVQNLDLGTVNSAHICDIIKSLQTKNSCDIDGISTKLLQKIATEISRPLAHIFNLSLTLGKFPDRLKTSRTVPIFKAGRSDLCDNYRPIALLSTMSKILEKIVCVQLINHLDRNKILYKHQYGFQRGKSTEHSIVHALNFISKAMNENKFTIGVFFDLKKAFDVCSHDILLMKLSKMGITGSALEWFRSYLSGRSQIVDIGGNLSRARNIKISVLQGSILGPILFLCFINDLHSVTELLTLMYADDTFSLESGDDLLELSNFINAEINKMAVWFRANKLAVNINKTKYMIFKSKGKKIVTEPVIVYNENEPNHPIDNNLITVLERYHDNHESVECRSYKLLGIFLDEHLTLDAHVNHICNKLTRSLFCIKQAKHTIPLSGLKSLYFALVHSHLTYCTLILNSITASNRKRLEKVQKKAIRIMTGSSYNAHTKPLFLQHAILPFDKLIIQSQLNFMHAIEYKYAPASFNNVWIKNNEREPANNLRNANDFYLPMPRTEAFKKSIAYSLPASWNELQPEIKFQENAITFKWALKAHLLESILDD
jgi:sarcosine oxidase/L-pipecolate oxidase